MTFFKARAIPVDSLFLKNPTKNLDIYLSIRLEVFPSGKDRFNRTGISTLGFVFSNQDYKPNQPLGLTTSLLIIMDYLPQKTSKSSSTGIAIGAAAGGSVVMLLLLLAGFYAFRQKRRAARATQQSNAFASWDANTSSNGGPQLKGARCFSYEDLRKCTNNFSEVNAIGSGGYGKIFCIMLAYTSPELYKGHVSPKLASDSFNSTSSTAHAKTKEKA
ncbi:hypothetical protein POM88_050244 [Heracleum sosnowskyi]|uniref:Uncharacterized protein n=1 Tax=Heracleum sosnowskyi TaxID=360622 RepID=A0AAD8M2G5_9APIA|nr:hypothetical protein POM88_050244 [Heracleum sosnowskyi]